MPNLKINKFFISYLLLITIISVNGNDLSQANPFNYLELDLCLKADYGFVTDLGDHFTSKFEGHLIGCHHEYNISEVKYIYTRVYPNRGLNVYYNDSAYSSYVSPQISYDWYIGEAEFTLVLYMKSLIGSEPIYDFHEDYIKQCFEDKNKFKDHDKNVTIKIRGLRNYSTKIEDIVPDYFQVDLQVQLFKSWYLYKFQEVNYLEEYFLSKFDGTLKACLCNYNIMRFLDKKLIDSTTYNVTLLLQRDTVVPVGECIWNEHYKSALECFKINNNLISLPSSVRVVIQSAKPAKWNEIMATLTESYPSEIEQNKTSFQGEQIAPQSDSFARKFLSNLTPWHGLLIGGVTLLLIYCVVIVMYRKKLERLFVNRTKIPTMADDSV